MRNVLRPCESSNTGGAESVLIGLVERLDKNRYRSMVCLLSDGWLKVPLEKPQIETVVIPQPHSFDLPWLFRLRRLLKDRRVHTMHSHEFAANVYASFLSTVTGIPLIATAHGKNYYGERWRRRLAYRFVARQSLMVAVSYDLQGVSGPTGRDPSGQHPGRAQWDRPQPLCDPGGRSCRSSGAWDQRGPTRDRHRRQFVRRERADILTEGMPGGGAHLPNFVLLVAGEGEQFDPLEKEAFDLGIADNVKFLGFRDDVPSLLQAMDVFALPSLSEGLPLSILEALALQKPVVATNVGGIPEIVEDGATGYLVPLRDPEALADKILLFLRDPRLAASIGQAGRKKVETAFGLEKMVRDYQSLYEEAR